MVLAALQVSALKGVNRNAAQYRQLETDKKLSASTQVPGCWPFLSGNVTGWDLGSMTNS